MNVLFTLLDLNFQSMFEGGDLNFCCFAKFSLVFLYVRQGLFSMYFQLLLKEGTSLCHGTGSGSFFGFEDLFGRNPLKLLTALVQVNYLLCLGIIKGSGGPGFKDLCDSHVGKGGAELGLEACSCSLDPGLEARVSRDLKGVCSSVSEEPDEVIAKAS